MKTIKLYPSIRFIRFHFFSGSNRIGPINRQNRCGDPFFCSHFFYESSQAHLWYSLRLKVRDETRVLLQEMADIFTPGKFNSMQGNQDKQDP
jgi:hypothetical protein